MLLNKMPGMHIKGHVTFRQIRFYWRWCTLLIEYIIGSQTVILSPFLSVKKCVRWKRAPQWKFFVPYRLSAASLLKNRTSGVSLCCTSVMIAMQWRNIHDRISKEVHAIQKLKKKSNSTLLFATILRNFTHLTKVTFDRKPIYINRLPSTFLT